MKKTYLTLSILLWLLLAHLVVKAQSSEEEYYTEKAKLSLEKMELPKTIAILKTEIDSLNYLIPILKQQVITSHRELYVLKYGEELGQRVAYNRIWKGMTDEMVQDSWGEADRIDKNVEQWGVFTQLYYGDVTFFFRDGKLIDWEEGEKGSNGESFFYLNDRK